MKILFTSEEVIDICDGKYYSMNLGQHLLKYSYMGEVTCVCYCREVKSTKLPEIEKTLRSLYSLRKKQVRLQSSASVNVIMLS